MKGRWEESGGKCVLESDGKTCDMNFILSFKALMTYCGTS